MDHGPWNRALPLDHGPWNRVLPLDRALPTYPLLSPCPPTCSCRPAPVALLLSPCSCRPAPAALLSPCSDVHPHPRALILASLHARSFAQAATDPSITEVTAGSGLLQSHLFDYFVINENACAFCYGT